jgi:two-component system, response regulator YesN
MSVTNSKFMRNLILSYSALLVVVLIMGAYLYSISISNVSTEIRNQNKFILEKNMQTLDIALKNMDVLAVQIVDDSNIVRLANATSTETNAFYLMAYHAQNSLSVYGSAESSLPINSSFIYFPKTNYILSSFQFQTAYFHYTSSLNYYKDKYDQWLELMNSDTQFKTLVSINTFKLFRDPTYLYRISLDNFTFKNVPAVLCYEFDTLKLGQLFSELHFFESGYLYVTDSQGEPIFNLNRKTLEDIPTQTLKSLSFENGFAQYTEDESDMFVTTSNSGYNGWQYYLVQPVDDSLYSLKQYRDIFIFIIALGLLFELLTVLFLSRTNVKKITQLGVELEDTKSKQEILQQLVENQKPIIMNTYLANIMEGNISTQEELDYAQQYLGITTTDSKLSVLYMATYVNQFELHLDNTAVTGPDSMDYQEFIEDAIGEFFGKPAYIYKVNEREYAILISNQETQSNEAATLHAMDSFNALHDYLQEKHSIWSFAGLGEWNLGLMLTWKSYQQATQAISYATKHQIFRCYSDIERDNNGFYYPIELTRQLINFITTGNSSQVFEIFEIIRQENMEKRSIPHNMVKFLLSDIRNTLYKIRFTIESNSKNEHELAVIDDLFEQHLSLKLSEDLATLLCQLFEKKTSGNELIVTIKSYIDDNYRDPSLCLNKISDEFPISESYFSYLFKEETGENFSSYLEHKRMERALELLKDTNLSVTDVYTEVGYNNSHTFRRVFKKMYGMLPTEIRSQNKPSV